MRVIKTVMTSSCHLDINGDCKTVKKVKKQKSGKLQSVVLSCKNILMCISCITLLHVLCACLSTAKIRIVLLMYPSEHLILPILLGSNIWLKLSISLMLNIVNVPCRSVGGDT